MKPLRCLFATSHWYAPQMRGGAQSSTHELCTELMARGHQVGVLAQLRPFTAIAAQHRVRKLVSGGDAVRDDIMGYPVFRCRHPPREAVDDVIARFNPDVAVVQLVGHARTHAPPLRRAARALEAHFLALLAHHHLHVGLARIADDGDTLVGAGLALHGHGREQRHHQHQRRRCHRHEPARRKLPRIAFR